MWVYLGRRLITSILVLLGVSVLTFLMLHMVPGDPVHAILGKQSVSPEKIEELRQQLGLNDPLPVQYYHFISRALQGDLGRSIRSSRPVWTAIMEQLPSTLQLTGAAMLIALLLGLPLGVLSAFRRSGWQDSLITLLAISGVSVPSFFLGLLLIVLFSLQLGWLPSVAPSASLVGLILPALTLGLGEGAFLTRLVRSSCLEELNKLYLWTARAKGADERRVMLTHALRNALIPIVTIISLQIVYLLAGSVVVESIFARQGIGRLAVTAIQNRDFPLIQGIVLVIAAMYVAVNTLTDIVYAFIDPRIRLQ
ncbi:MAG: ABC transporter permease [Chloroflexi bacterium]|jgi:peptide/nickel transport system permease protein|nr:nickel ABC transporter permease [Anaerolineaceae bacterium]NMB90304.1 ABC transporter permease [Chloroflexota bacterium]